MIVAVQFVITHRFLHYRFLTYGFQVSQGTIKIIPQHHHLYHHYFHHPHHDYYYHHSLIALSSSPYSSWLQVWQHYLWPPLPSPSPFGNATSDAIRSFSLSSRQPCLNIASETPKHCRLAKDDFCGKNGYFVNQHLVLLISPSHFSGWQSRHNCV